MSGVEWSGGLVITVHNCLRRVSTQVTNLSQRRYKSSSRSFFWNQSIVRLQLEHSYNGFQEISYFSRPCPSSRSRYETYFSERTLMYRPWLQLRQVKYDPTRHVTSWNPSRRICLKTYSRASAVILLVFCLLIMSIYLMTVKAHGALRLSFHDAIGISPTLG